MTNNSRIASNAILITKGFSGKNISNMLCILQLPKEPSVVLVITSEEKHWRYHLCNQSNWENLRNSQTNFQRAKNFKTMNK